MTENTSFTNTSQDTEQADDAARGPDMFARATEVAAAARDVRMMAEHAHRKASYIAALQERAFLEADELSRIAHSVADTATSVAVMALQACQYRSFEEAFQSNSRYGQVIDMDSFLDVVDHSPGRNRAHNSTDVADDDAQAAPRAASGRNSTTRKSAFQTRRPRSHVDKPSKQSSSPGGSNHGLQDTDPKYLEKFPGPTLQNRDSLAQSINHCSSKTEAPLYENVYAGPHRAPAADVTPSSDSWAERKTRKQFQIKLQQQDSEEGCPLVDDNIRTRERSSLSALVKPSFPRGVSESLESHMGVSKSTRTSNPRLNDRGVAIPRIVPPTISRRSTNSAMPPPRAREDTGESTTDSEIEDYMTTPRQVALVKAVDCSDVDGQRLLPKTQPTNRVLSPLLDHEEQNVCRVVNKSPVQATFQFQPRPQSDREDDSYREDRMRKV